MSQNPPEALSRGARGQRPPSPVTLASAGAAPAEAIATPPRLRRRPALVAMAVILVAVGALLAAWLATSIGNTRSVVAVRTDIARGHMIAREDLLVVDITPDPALKTVPASRIDTIIGRYARFDMAAGGLVTSTAVTDKTVPVAGQSLVGLSLTPAQLPARPLQPGDTVRIVTTPRQQDDPPTTPPASVPATVVDTHPVGDQGQVVVDVTVPKANAAELAATAATGRIALVLDSAGGA